MWVQFSGQNHQLITDLSGVQFSPPTPLIKKYKYNIVRRTMNHNKPPLTTLEQILVHSSMTEKDKKQRHKTLLNPSNFKDDVDIRRHKFFQQLLLQRKMKCLTKKGQALQKVDAIRALGGKETAYEHKLKKQERKRNKEKQQ